MIRLQHLCTAVLLAATATAVPTTVDVGYTKYVGSALSTGITQWMGMRYAAAPIGDLRFMPPQDPPNSDEPQPADTVSQAAPPSPAAGV